MSGAILGYMRLHFGHMTWESHREFSNSHPHLQMTIHFTPIVFLTLYYEKLVGSSATCWMTALYRTEQAPCPECPDRAPREGCPYAQLQRVLPRRGVREAAPYASLLHSSLFTMHRGSQGETPVRCRPRTFSTRQKRSGKSRSFFACISLSPESPSVCRSRRGWARRP